MRESMSRNRRSYNQIEEGGGGAWRRSMTRRGNGTPQPHEDLEMLLRIK